MRKCGRRRGEERMSFDRALPPIRGRVGDESVISLS